jgi:hypothetical protein
MPDLTSIQGVEVHGCGIDIHLVAIPVAMVEEPTEKTEAVFRFHYVLTGFANGAVLAIDDLDICESRYTVITEAAVEGRLRSLAEYLEHVLALMKLTAEKVHVEPKPYEYLAIFIAMLQKHGFPFNHQYLTPYLLYKIRKVVR